MKSTLLSILFVLSSITLTAQSFIGLIQDNYAGVHGILQNPAFVHGSPYKLDFNIASASGQGAIDAYKVNFTKLINDDDYDIFDNDESEVFLPNNNATVNADVLGPSFMLGLGQKSSMALYSRARAFVNVNGLKGQLVDEFEAIGEDMSQPFLVAEEETNISVHGWGEVGLAYARTLVDTGRHHLVLGVSAKYLQGLGGANIDAKDLVLDYQGADQITAGGTLSYSYTDNLDPEGDFEFSQLPGATGMGFDLGFSYELKKVKTDSASMGDRIYKRDYVFKLGLAITDIGKITYEDALIEGYNFDNSLVFDESAFDQDIFDVLDELATPINTQEAFEMQLPTSIRANLDLQASKRFYLNLGANISLINTEKSFSNRYFDSYIIAPRFQTKFLTIGSALVHRQHTGWTWGGSLRIGPLFVGSGSVLSNLLSDEDSNAADVYAGLKIPIYKRLKVKPIKEKKARKREVNDG